MTPRITGWIDASATVRHGMPHWPGKPLIARPRLAVSHLARWAILGSIGGNSPAGRDSAGAAR